MTPRRATVADATRLARLNVHVQSWHAAQYPKAFFADPDPHGLVAFFAGRLADPDCTAFLIGEPATAYVLCQLQVREGSVFSPPVRRLIVDQIAVAPDACRQGQGRALLRAARELGRGLGVDEILLDTWEGNRDAHAFFRAMGFAPRRMLFRATP